MSWSREDLLAKAKLFSNYAAELDATDLRYPLWMTVSLEMIGRAALAQVNPCLLADIRSSNDDNAGNLFYACGILTGDKTPTSVAASTVFKRCRVVVPNFTEADVRWCNEFASKRNEELHSGSSPYLTFTTDRWLADYYRIAQVILVFLGADLQYLFGQGTASVAQALIADQKAHIKKQTLDTIQSAKIFLVGLTPDEVAHRAEKTTLIGQHSKRIPCPTGDHQCIVTGEISQVSEPRLDQDNDIVVARTIIPTGLLCVVCGLKLTGNAALVEAGAGAPFIISSVQDPVDFHGIERMDYVSDSDVQHFIQNHYEPDYGND